jgi:hypothetical protein
MYVQFIIIFNGILTIYSPNLFFRLDLIHAEIVSFPVSSLVVTANNSVLTPDPDRMYNATPTSVGSVHTMFGSTQIPTDFVSSKVNSNGSGVHTGGILSEKE